MYINTIARGDQPVTPVSCRQSVINPTFKPAKLMHAKRRRKKEKEGSTIRLMFYVSGCTKPKNKTWRLQVNID